MKIRIPKIALLIKESKISNYNKLIVQLFLEWSFYRKFINLDKGYLELNLKEIENILNNPISFSKSGLIPLNKDVNKTNLESNKLIKILKKFVFIYRYLNSYITTFNSFFIYLYKSLYLNKKEIRFIFETKKCKHLWSNYKNVIFFGIEDLNLITYKKISKKITFKNISNKSSIRLEIRDIISDGLETTIFNILRNKKISFLIKENNKSFRINEINNFIVLRLFKLILKNNKNNFFIDNSSGLLIQSLLLKEFINEKRSILFNSQHGGGYFELNKSDMLLTEISPAYNYPLIGIYRSSLIRPNYPVNGSYYRLKNKKLNNSVLIIEGADAHKKESFKRKNDFKYSTKVFSKLIKIFSKNNLNCLIKKHPRSYQDWGIIQNNLFIDKVEKIPLKYIPDKNDFKLICLIGLGHTLFYHLIKTGASFCVIADESEYSVSKSGVKHIKFLKKNNLLISTKEISHLGNLEFINNLSNNSKNLKIEKLFNKDALPFEEWVAMNFYEKQS